MRLEELIQLHFTREFTEELTKAVTLSKIRFQYKKESVYYIYKFILFVL